MYLFNRAIYTNGDMEALMPLFQESIVLMKSAGVSMNVWAGGNGFQFGTVGFSVAYESLAARAAVNAKLGTNKSWWALARKMTEYARSWEPDTIYQYVRGGTIGTDIPLGTVVNQNQIQTKGPNEWKAAIQWANEHAELCKQITGIDTNVLHTIYGKLGDVTMLTCMANAAAVDEYRAKLMASAEFMPKFLEGAQYAIPETIVQRQLVKIA